MHKLAGQETTVKKLCRKENITNYGKTTVDFSGLFPDNSFQGSYTLKAHVLSCSSFPLWNCTQCGYLGLGRDDLNSLAFRGVADKPVGEGWTLLPFPSYFRLNSQGRQDLLDCNVTKQPSTHPSGSQTEAFLGDSLKISTLWGSLTCHQNKQDRAKNPSPVLYSNLSTWLVSQGRDKSLLCSGS